jgi:hypothetical protein
VNVAGSTISGNSADGDGGGLYIGGASAYGSPTQRVTLSGNTFSGNSAHRSGGGVFLNPGVEADAALRHSTITLNSAAAGGGVFLASGTLALSHTIAARNTAPVGPDLTGLFGALVDPRFNFIGNSANSGFSDSLAAEPDANGNIFGPSHGVLDPLLGPLADNGGPTKTHALLPDSLALNAGDPSAVAGVDTIPQFDQRGAPFVRVFGSRIDIGAYERQSVANLNLLVDSLADVIDGDYSAGQLTLREAIGLSQGSVDTAETISFAPSLTAAGHVTIVLTRGELPIRDSLTINGPGANLLTIDASGNDPRPESNNGDGSRVFNIDDGDAAGFRAVKIIGLTLTGGDVANDGGAIQSFEMLTVQSSVVTGNAAGFDGGGIHSGRYGGNYGLSSLTVIDSTISNNLAGLNSPDEWTGNGGGISAYNGLLNVTGTTISGNSTTHSGGGIWNWRAHGQSGTILNSTISGNSAGIAGGGVYGGAGQTAIRHTTITNNEAPDGQGSGIAAYAYVAASLELYSSIVAGNVHSDVDIRQGNDLSIRSFGFNIVGTGNAIGAFDKPGDLSGVAAPLLGPLADNGGPTMTHALLTGSPAIDAGDPTAAAGVGSVPEFDQRRNPFGRVYDGGGGMRVDVGAFELQPMQPAFFGDYNRSGEIDTADYVVWRKTLGTNVAAYTGADGSGDGVVDEADYPVWRAQYGQSAPVTSHGAALASLTDGELSPAGTTREKSSLSAKAAAKSESFSQPLTASERDEAVSYFDLRPTSFAPQLRSAVRQAAALRRSAASIGHRDEESLLTNLALANAARFAFERGHCAAPRAKAKVSEAVETAEWESVDVAFAMNAHWPACRSAVSTLESY